jgi:SNF2 family DNA or RNA helicase
VNRSYGRVLFDDGWWRVETEPHIIMRLKRLFERIGKFQKGHLLIRDNPETGRELSWFLDRYPMDMPSASDRELLEKRRQEHIAQEAAVHQILFDKSYRTERQYQLALPLRDYQILAVELALRTGRLLVGDDVGTGKTWVGIGILSQRLPAVVVTLTHLPRQWKAEIERALPAARVHIAKSGRPIGNLDSYDVIILNYHKLSGWAGKLAVWLRGGSVIFDEVQELRRAEKKPGHLTQKYEAAHLIAGYAGVRCGLSATPVFNLGFELFNIMEIIAPGALGTEAEFKREWCEPAGNNRYLVTEPKAFGTYLRDQGLMIRRTREEIGRALPPALSMVHDVEADMDALDASHGTAAELARAILDKTKRSGFERMQEASEFSYIVRRDTGVAKANAVADFVRILVENGEKVVLYGYHHDVYAIWKERLKDLFPVFYTGQESANQKEHAKACFTKGTAKILIMSLRAGAGLDGLQGAANVVVFGELDWSPACHHQCVGRVHRDGQAKKTLVYYLVADCGSDPIVLDVLQVKHSQQHGIRDPYADLVEDAQIDPDHIKRLAASYLEQQKRTA